jgi:P2-related tail formation protein
MQLFVVPDADRQILTIDEWWRVNRPAAPDLFAEELASALTIIQSSPRIGRR